MFRLPPYAHELNAVELVWAHLKRSLANLTNHNIAELTAQVKMRLIRKQYRPGLLVGLLASTGLHVGALPVIPALNGLWQDCRLKAPFLLLVQRSEHAR